MSFPSVIERPLLADEISIYLDNSDPIPLPALATFLQRIAKEAQSVRGMNGLFLELSDFALGSNELRCRVVGPGRIQRAEAERQEKMLKAAERSARAGVVGAGAAVVSAVAAVVALAITSGSANAPTYKIMNQYNAHNVFVRAPNEDPHIITKRDVQVGRAKRLKAKRRVEEEVNSEMAAVLEAMDYRKAVDLGGWLEPQSDQHGVFETMNGNRFPVRFDHFRGLSPGAWAVSAIVHDTSEGPTLEIDQVYTRLSNV